MTIRATYLALLLSIFAAAPLFAQQAAGETGGPVLMLEEIRIQVAPELPTVVVTIPRQRPDIQSVSLKKSSEDLIRAGTAQIKPRLTDLQVSRIEEPQKMLAKERAQ